MSTMMANNHTTAMWQSVLGNLQLQVPRPSFDTWLKDTVGLAQDDDSFVVGTSSPFVAEMLEQRMYSLIHDAVEKVTGRRPEVRFVVIPSGAGDLDGAAELLPSGVDEGSDEEITPPVSRRETQLNLKYTFDTFIVGKSNELAHAASMAVAESPGNTYNPLVLYSGVGLGKTHLLHAIGHQIISQGRTVTYRTTEEFTNEYIKAIREGKTEEFRDFYRGTDALLLDDIQFIIGKEQTQEGFFHTFNALHMSNRQVVITSDRPVGALTLLEDRMRSRLAGGLVVDIQAPDLETRLAILGAKVDESELDFPSEVLDHIGGRVYKNIRELEGHLNRITAYAQMLQEPITLDLVKRATADILSDYRPAPISTEQVIDSVSNYFGVDSEALLGRRRDKLTALARQVAMYLLREETDMGLATIGKAMGGKDHSTVLHACTRIANRIDVDPYLRRDIVNVREALASSA